MPQINELSALDTISAGDLAPLWSTNNGDTRKTSMTLLREFMLSINSLSNTSITIEDTDTIAIYDNSASSTVQANVTALRTYLATSATDGTTLADADKFTIYDDSASSTVRITGTMVKTYIQENIFTGLSSALSLADADTFMIYDDSAAGTVKITSALVNEYIQANILSGLTAETTLANADKIIFYDDSAAATRSATLSALQSWLDTSLKSDFTTQTSSPSATGFTVAITDNSDNTHLILTPASGYATGTITLPSSLNVVDKQEVIVNTTQFIEALTVNGNGSTVSGAPQSIGADGRFRLKYDASSTTWYRIG